MLKKDFITYDFAKRLEKLTPEEQTACFENMKLEHYKKNDFLITEDQICTRVYLVVSGGVRSYTYKNDKEITNWFAFENEAFTAYYSYLTELPSQEIIQVMEDTTVYVLQKNTLQNLYNRFHGLESLGRELVEFYYRWQEERIFSLQSDSAKERYEKLIQQQPHLFQKATLGQIASYLGIAQETLSRIRNN
jgi:CRP-like cAMP-binding protein